MDIMLHCYIINRKNYKNKSGTAVKDTALKQQISKFYPRILSTEDSFYIYDRPLTDINVISSVYALNLLTILQYLSVYLCMSAFVVLGLISSVPRY